MTRDELYSFVTSLLDDFEMETTLFYTFLDVAQSNRENSRPWVILRTEDATQTVTTSNTYETQKNLPTDFRRFYARYPVVLVDSQGNVVKSLCEIPINMKNHYKNDGTKFYVNYTTRKLYICGTQSQNLTLKIYYIKKTTKISAAAANTWEFSAYDDYDKILGFDIAAMHKLGVDYDQINAAQANSNAFQAQLIFENMAEWDSYLAASAQEGVDYNSSPQTSQTEMGGSISNLV